MRFSRKTKLTMGPAAAGPFRLDDGVGGVVMRAIGRLGSDEGATAIEYAILVSAIAAVIVAIVYAIGVQNYLLFNGFWELFSSY